MPKVYKMIDKDLIPPPKTSEQIAKEEADKKQEEIVIQGLEILLELLEKKLGKEYYVIRFDEPLHPHVNKDNLLSVPLETFYYVKKKVSWLKSKKIAEVLLDAKQVKVDTLEEYLEFFVEYTKLAEVKLKKEFSIRYYTNKIPYWSSDKYQKTEVPLDQIPKKKSPNGLNSS